MRSNGFCVEKKEWHVPMMKLEVLTLSYIQIRSAVQNDEVNEVFSCIFSA